MNVTVSCGTCGGPCLGHLAQCIDCGRIGSHDPSVKHYLSWRISEMVADEWSRIVAEVTAAERSVES